MLPRGDQSVAYFKPISTLDVHDILDDAEERFALADPETRGKAPFRWALHEKLQPWIAEYMERDTSVVIGKFSLRPGRDRMLLATPSHIAQTGKPMPVDFSLRWTLIIPLAAGPDIDLTPYQP